MHRHVHGPAFLLAALLLSACPPRCVGTPAGCGRAADNAPVAKQPDEEFRIADDPDGPQPEVHRDDLAGVLDRGVLRVLVVARDEQYLPRRGLPSSHDRQLAKEFARRQGLKVRFMVAGSWDRLIPLLLEGRADLIASNLTVTAARAAQVAFTRPVAVVEELVVGRKGAPDLPRSVEELAGREIHVRQSSSFAETISELSSAVKLQAPIRLVPAPESLDSEALVYQVGRGERPLTIADSHTIDAILAYDDDVQPLFPVAEGRQIAWAVRKESPKLRSALDAFLIEKAMTGHTLERFTGDLDGIEKRGVLRVLTRNNPITYYLYRGQQYGFDYELAELAAQELGVRLEMVVPPSRDLLIPWLLDGRGDVIAASLTVTPERQAQVAFSRPYLYVDEVLVQRATGPKLASLAELAGKRIHVRRSSSYRRTLESLQARYGPFEIVDEAEDRETEELIDAVAGGEIPFTVADSHLLDSELTWRDDVEAAFAVSTPRPGAEGSSEIAFAVRPGDPKLKAFFDGFVKESYRGATYNILRKRYFQNRRRAEVAKVERATESGRLTPYDELLKKHSAHYNLDWRLMAAQAYQESRLDPSARSWAGALGLFQVVPVTGRELGFDRLEDPDQGIHAGIKYLARLIARFEPTLPFRQRIRFALASYNVGYGHVADARRLAAELGLDPNRWFHNVERAMLLLEKPKYYRRARHGFCRGQEPVKYVSEIQNRYDNYVELLAPFETPEQ